MATTMDGLFGPSPYEIQQQRAAQNQAAAAAYAQQAPLERAAAGMYNAGGMLGGMAANAMGMTDPAVENARRMQSAAQGVDTSTPEGLLQYAAKIKDFDPSRAAQAVTMARDMKAKMDAAALAVRKQDTLDAAQLATSNLQAAQAEKAFRDNPNLTPVEVGVKGKPGWLQKILFDKTGKEESIPIGEPYQTAQAMKISVGGTGGGESKQMQPYLNEQGIAIYGAGSDLRGKPVPMYDPVTRALVSGATTGGKAGVDMSVKDYGVARGAVSAIPKVDALISQLEKGDVITGSAADLRTGLAKVTSLLGGKDAAKTASDTEIAEAMMGSEVFPLIQSLGIGAKGMDTPAEREFIRSVLTGSKSMEKETLLQLARMRKKELQNGISRWDESVDTGSRDTFFRSTGIPKVKFGKPVTPPTPNSDKFVAGKQYRDAKGNVATYLGNGQWK